jgi:nanoRNase/pAp phosphatase (c-di-AMP/oligoRNAs hydrolase)
MKLQFKKMMKLLQNIEKQRIVLLCHHNADPDAVCSTYAFSQILKKILPKIKVEVAAKGVSKLSENILKTIPEKFVSSPNIEDSSMIILLDTNNTQQLDDWKTKVESSRKTLVVIDHHAVHPQTKNLATLCIIDEEATSTCEIVYELFKQAKIIPKKTTALALFIGIVYDTKHFVYATSKTFKIVADLISLGVNAEDSLSLLALPMNSSERIARLKAAARLELFKINEWLLAFSSIGSYQASAARALLGLGAHVAVVGGEKKGSLKISMRASKEFNEKTDIHLGKSIARPLSNYLNGMGGGHSTAAGFNGEGSVETAFRECLKLFRDCLKY